MLSIELKILICFVWAFIVFFITALIIGNEGKGISANIKKQVDEMITIPMSGHVQSLNASVAAAVLMYEVYRNRL